MVLKLHAPGDRVGQAAQSRSTREHEQQRAQTAWPHRSLPVPLIFACLWSLMFACESGSLDCRKHVVLKLSRAPHNHRVPCLCHAPWSSFLHFLPPSCFALLKSTCFEKGFMRSRHIHAQTLHVTQPACKQRRARTSKALTLSCYAQ